MKYCDSNPIPDYFQFVLPKSNRTFYRQPSTNKCLILYPVPHNQLEKLDVTRFFASKLRNIFTRVQLSFHEYYNFIYLRCEKLLRNIFKRNFCSFFFDITRGPPTNYAIFLFQIRKLINSSVHSSN